MNRPFEWTQVSGSSYISQTRFVRALLARSRLHVQMHQCLEIPEILEIICKILKNDFDNNVNRESLSTLSSVARTCRCFHELALDILWHSLDSLVPLLKTFPRSLWNVAQVANGETLLVRNPMFYASDPPHKRIVLFSVLS